MPLKPREKSSTGIYHVMFRGINKQNIFYNEDDKQRLQIIIRDAPFVKDPNGGIIADDVCTIYAYCLLDNHVHLLIKEGSKTLSEIIKSIELRYSKYYNQKYERIGHLFQGRFPSEPVNDEIYFRTLLRYIHRNPVKAMEAPTPEEYVYSSWNEYVNHPSNTIQVIRPEAKEYVLDKFPLPELIEWVNKDKDDRCLDMNSFRNVITDKDSFEILQDTSGIDNLEDFRLYDAPTQIYYLLQIIERGVSIRQASRLGTITLYQLEKAYLKKVGAKSITVSDTVIEEKLAQNEVSDNEGECCDKELKQINDRIRQIQGLGKKSYFQMHLIVEYLFEHQNSKCSDIAVAIRASREGTRRYLMILVNENIVSIEGNNRGTKYSLIR